MSICSTSKIEILNGKKLEIILRKKFIRKCFGKHPNTLNFVETLITATRSKSYNGKKLFLKPKFIF